MRFLTHLLFGLLFGLLFLDYFNIEHKVIFILLICFGSVVPDIDYRGSKIGRRFKLISWAVNLLFGHRGFMHTIFPPLVIFAIAIILGYSFLGFGFMFGYLLHLVSDSLTIEGTRMFKPFFGWHVRGWVRTGGITEYVFLFLLVIALIWKFYKYLL